jgi:hypothetical protein
MGTRSQDPDDTLEALATKIERWRRTRVSSRGPMPEELWRAAVGLCEHFTVHSVSRSLRLGYDRLRRRCAEAQIPRPVVSSNGVDDDPLVQFVEIGRSAEPAAGPAPAGAHEVELVRRDGARMILRSREPLDLRQLTGAFLEGGR